MGVQSVISISDMTPRSPAPAFAGGLRATFSDRRQRFHPGDHLFYQGDTPSGVYRLTSGTVIVYRMTLDGQRQIQDFAGPGDLLGLNLSGVQSTSAEALTAVESEVLARSTFERALESDPDFRHAVFAEIDTLLTAAREQSLLLGFRCAMERTSAFLLFLVTRFEADADGFVPILMSRSDIADYLGLTLETVSRMLNRLKHDRVIDLPRPDRFRVLQCQRLYDLAGLSGSALGHDHRLSPFAA